MTPVAPTWAGQAGKELLPDQQLVDASVDAPSFAIPVHSEDPSKRHCFLAHQFI
ncbi:MAG: hypothetical protein PVS3B3_33110 [Ktedonobacteraceae bacterium]